MAIRHLSDNPDLAHYKRQAKRLHKALLAAEAGALSRLAEYHPRAGEIAPAKLADAQLVLAREHGFSSWPAFAAEVRAKRPDVVNGFPASVACEKGDLALDIDGFERARAVVLFVLAGNVGAQNRGIRQIAARFRGVALCTALVELLTADEVMADAIDEELRFDVGLLSARAELVLDAIRGHARLAGLPLALLCAGTGGAAGVSLAAKRPDAVAALVSVAGRPDLAGAALARVRAPSLFVVGGEDPVAHGFTRTMIDILPRDVPRSLEVVRGVGARFEEGPAARRGADLSIDWFARHLQAAAGTERGV